MKTTIEIRCLECGAICAPSFNEHWPECPRCSRISRYFKPPDFHPAGEWDFPDVDGVELAMSWGRFSLTEHASES
jgi:hypothetical protein